LACLSVCAALSLCACSKCPANCQVFRGKQADGKTVEMCARSSNFLRNGPYTEFGSNGKPELVGQYADNVKFGIWRALDGEGRLKQAICYGDGGKVRWRESRNGEVEKRSCP